MLQLRNRLSQKIKIKGMYMASVNPPYKPVEPQRGRWNAVAAVMSCISHLTCSYFLFPTSQSLLYCHLYFHLASSSLLQSNSSFQNFHSHTSVWFSSAPFGSVQAASGTSLMYNNQRGCNHT